MDMKEIRAILDFMEQNGLVEFEYEEDGKRVKLRKSEGRPVLQAAPASNAVPSAVTAAPETGSAPENLVYFRSPLVGTFYRSPKPGAPPFVEVGDEVTTEQVLCIVEAMKVMNELKSPVDGTIREIRVKDGQAVEFNDVLFVIEKK